MTPNINKEQPVPAEESVNQEGLLSQEDAEKEAYGDDSTDASDDDSDVVSTDKVIDEDVDQESEEVAPQQEEPTADEQTTDEQPTAEEPSEFSTADQSTGDLDLKQASELAKQKLSEALNKPANATISIEDQGDHWLAVVEIVEEEYLPGQNLKSMNDLLGVYEIKLSHNGKLLKWTRKKSYKRAEIT
jgi:hypothetical protein